jgi:hypothetical protein
MYFRIYLFLLYGEDLDGALGFAGELQGLEDDAAGALAQFALH